METLLVRLSKACVGGCTCMTKTPDIEYHNEVCHYRLFQECIFEILRNEREKDEN